MSGLRMTEWAHGRKSDLSMKKQPSHANKPLGQHYIIIYSAHHYVNICILINDVSHACFRSHEKKKMA